MNKFETVIGLEIHVQLKTKSKMFSDCPVPADAATPNTAVDPLTLGHPGTLPVINEQAVRYAVMAALALHCEINRRSWFDRKSYFYPDLPKGYQISQSEKPFGYDGHLIVQYGEKRERIRIERVHLEEDTGKLLHDTEKNVSYVDYNRAGTPLMEVVTHPDFDTPEAAKAFLQELRLIMRYLGISDADMEKGHLRCDANISLRPNPSYFTDEKNAALGSIGLDPKKLYPKTEIKNLNSFRAVERALTYEIKRQTELWLAGTPPDAQSTRGWNDATGETVLQRVKEEQHDYRYFPEPDLPPVVLDDAFMDSVKMTLGELPQDKRERFHKQFGLNAYDAGIIVSDKVLADYFENVISELRAWLIADAGLEGTEEEVWANHGLKLVKSTANWIISRLLKLVNTHGGSFADLPITPENFAELMTLLFQHRVNNQTGQVILEKMFATGGDPSELLEQSGLGVQHDAKSLEAIIIEVLQAHPDRVAEYRAGKKPVLQYLIGQVMRASKGTADAQSVAELLQEKLDA
ncbi:MAG: Asp-tRNA(Asn)/Glu-tRNA(Gln) amidotransferase subunit GatB [Candidatus Kerfeldbacteria bacterium]|nr:Asp-tRNA(Asn)/Glu-tRNA(Gln) amidotransferase subunit GatB [Candidatus Kerfeldbacteria bacterium]